MIWKMKYNSFVFLVSDINTIRGIYHNSRQKKISNFKYIDYHLTQSISHIVSTKCGQISPTDLLYRLRFKIIFNGKGLYKI